MKIGVSARINLFILGAVVAAALVVVQIVFSGLEKVERVCLTVTLLALMATVIRMIFTRFLTRPMQSIIEVAKAYGEGGHMELGRLPLGRRDEIGELAHVIRDAVTTRRKAEELLQRDKATLEAEVKTSAQGFSDNESRLRAILDTAVDGILTINTRGLISHVNPAVEKMFGYAPEELMGKNVSILMPEPYHSEHDQYLRNYSETGKRKIIGIGREVSARKKNGEVFPIDLAVSEVNLSGERMYVGMIRDISERKEIEHSLKLSYDELMRSNRALDEFAYIASHDLKEPLRGIYNFAELLKQQTREKLAPEEVSRLDTIIRLSKKMSARIQSLLHYSQLESAEARQKEEDLNKVIDEIREMLQPFLDAQHAVIRVPEPLPPAVCSRVAMMEVFQNLITNAVKYNTSAEKLVEIGASLKDGQQVFHVKDNGIGIPKRHHDSIFRIFKRLHPEDAYGGGTGAGLTFVRRILENHGGHIWLESKEGEGTTFYFVLKRGSDDRKQHVA